MAESSADVIKRYVADAIAIEKSFETQLHRFAKEADNEAAKAVFQKHAAEARQHNERLTARLHEMEGGTPVSRGFLPHIFGLGLKSSQLGSGKPERAAHEATIAYSVENSLLAVYESLATMAEAAGDADTGDLARRIQSETQVMAQEIWKLLPGLALDAHARATASRLANYGS